jgi:hypothetical protein
LERIMTKQQQQGVDNRANQLNPTHPAYYLARDYSPEEAERLAAKAALESRTAAQSDTAPQPSGK